MGQGLGRYRVKDLAGPVLAVFGLLASLFVLVSGPNPDQTYWQGDFLYVGWVPGILGTAIAVLFGCTGRVRMMSSAVVAGALSGAVAAIAGLQIAQGPACESAWYMTITRMVPVAAAMSGAAALIISWPLSRVLSSTGAPDTKFVRGQPLPSARRIHIVLLVFTVLLASVLIALSGPKTLPAAIGVTKCTRVTAWLPDGYLAGAGPSRVLAALSQAQPADGWPANISGEADVHLGFHLALRRTVDLWVWYCGQSVFLSDQNTPSGSFVYQMLRSDFDRSIPFAFPAGVGRVAVPVEPLPANLPEGFYVIALDGPYTLVPRIDLGDAETLVLGRIDAPAPDTYIFEFSRRSGATDANSLLDGLANPAIEVVPERSYRAIVDGQELPIFWRAWSERWLPAWQAVDAYPPVLHVGGFGAPRPVGGSVNSPGNEYKPSISADGMQLAFMYEPGTGQPDARSGVWLADLADVSGKQPEYQVFPEWTTETIQSALFSGESLWAIIQGPEPTGGARLGKYRSGLGRKWLSLSIPHLFDLDMRNPESAWINTGEDLIVWAEEREGGYGGLDLWTARRSADSWGPVVNLGPAINGAGNEASPFVSPDGKELWYTGMSRQGQGTAVFRSRMLPSGKWGQPQEVLSGNCSDPSVDAAGNLYFSHVSTDSAGQPIGSDVYVALRNP